MPRQTYFAKAGDVTPEWHHFDADGKVLGRLATARGLR
jgi:ribosomal protein L13